MSNTEKIKALVAKIRESLQITPYATMETVNDLLEIWRPLDAPSLK